MLHLLQVLINSHETIWQIWFQQLINLVSLITVLHSTFNYWALGTSISVLYNTLNWL